MAVDRGDNKQDKSSLKVVILLANEKQPSLPETRGIPAQNKPMLVIDKITSVPKRPAAPEYLAIFHNN